MPQSGGALNPTTQSPGGALTVSALWDYIGGVNDPNFANRTVWTRDNLDVLRGINSECVDLIYLDPPYNSKRNFAAPIGSKAAGAAFQDTWSLSDVDLAWHGEIAEQSPALYSAVKAVGMTHGKSMQSYVIMMAVRLLEMKRVLKPTGSIYLQVDDMAVHYLKMLMDCIFGTRQFRAHVVWQRCAPNKPGRNFGRITDHVLYYVNGNSFTWNKQCVPIQEHELKKYRFVHAEPDGRVYRRGSLDAVSTPHSFTWRGTTPKHGWRHPLEKLEELYADGRIMLRRDGRPAIAGLKVYLDEYPGTPVANFWPDIAYVAGNSKERTGYPTQKPLKLLDRIIRASSNEGDVVLDPFCGCATTMVAAETLGRRWAGIDLSPLAAQLVDQRLRDVHGAFGQIAARTDIPRRTDLGKLPHYRTHRHRLYGRQEGNCNGCRIHFPFQNFTVDHVVPKSKGGTDHLSNLQLLCNACNSKKGARSHEHLIARLKREGIIT